MRRTLMSSYTSKPWWKLKYAKKPSLHNEICNIGDFDPTGYLSHARVFVLWTQEDWGHIERGSIHIGTVVGVKENKYVCYFEQQSGICYQGTSNAIESDAMFVFNPMYKTRRKNYRIYKDLQQWRQRCVKQKDAVFQSIISRP